MWHARGGGQYTLPGEAPRKGRPLGQEQGLQKEAVASLDVQASLVQTGEGHFIHEVGRTISAASSQK